MTASDPQARIMDLQRKAKQQLAELKATLAELDEIRARRNQQSLDTEQRPRLRVIAGGRP